MVEGPTVFPGYWGQPPRSGEAYGTGDIVRLGVDGEFYFLGRRDNMVKVRGHRIELAEIEAVLLQHASVRDAAAVVVGEGLTARLVAFLAVGQHGGAHAARRQAPLRAEAPALHDPRRRGVDVGAAEES